MVHSLLIKDNCHDTFELIEGKNWLIILYLWTIRSSNIFFEDKRASYGP